MATIRYARLDEFWRKEQKYTFLEQQAHVGNVPWQPITPDKRHTWLTEGMQDEFESFLPMGARESKSSGEDAIFINYGRGVATGRDCWVYNFDPRETAKNTQHMIEAYNKHVLRLERIQNKVSIDEFVSNDEREISWSESLKFNLQRRALIEFNASLVRQAIYRPFTREFLYFDPYINERRYQMPSMFPLSSTENRLICVTDKGSEKPFMALATNHLTDLHIVGAGASSQCFPFYTYAEDGSNRRENITDWALAQFQQRYTAQSPNHPLTKWDIFHYVYALLHHPDYRAKYAANLRRELPRIPFVADFWGFAQAGAKLADLHVHYEQQPEYHLEFVENPNKPLDWRVERLKLSKERTSLVYNDFLTLRGIPPAVYEYKLGNRSALEWVIDQYQVSTDKRSGIVNDPNNPADPQAIVRLIGQVITVSLATVAIVNHLPPLNLLP